MAIELKPVPRGLFSMKTAKLLLLTLAAALAGCSGSCGRSVPSKPIARERVGAPNEDLPRDLKPLPEPPKLDIPPEAFPGAGSALAVVTATPQGDLKGPVRPVVVFSKPVTSLAAAETQQADAKAHPVGRFDPPLEGEWHWLGSASVEFIPKGLVPYSTHYSVTVPKGLKAIDGSALEEDYSFSFNTPKLTLQDVTPQRDYRWIKPDETIKLLFDQPVKDAELAQALYFEVDGAANPWKAQVMARSSIADERRRAEEKAKHEERRYERMDPAQKGFKNQQTRYEIAAEKTFPLDKQVTLVIPASLHGEQGPLPMVKEERLTWRVYGPMELQGAKMCPGPYHCPYGPLALFTSNEADLQSLKGKVTVTPPVEIDWEHAQAYSPHAYYGWEKERPYVSLPGNFRPGIKYSIAIAGGVTDVFGQHDARPFKAEVRTDDLEPSLYTGGGIALVEASSGPKLPIEVTNLKHLDIRAWAQTPADMAQELGERRYNAVPRPSSAAQVSEQPALRLKWNEQHLYGVDLTKALGPKGTGLAGVWLNSPDLPHASAEGSRVFVQITDLAVHLKFGPRSTVGWVTRLSSGDPVGDATVVAYDKNGKALWTGKSNADGFADLPGASELALDAEYAWQAPFMLVAASKDGDTGITTSQWSQGVEAYEFNLNQGWEGDKPESSGFIFTDRGIYRPGDTVYVKGVARFRRIGQLASPEAGSTLALTITDSRGQQVKTEQVTITKYGTFATKVEIPATAPTGSFGIGAVGNTTGGTIAFNESFRVEEYRAPQFKVDVQADASDLIAGDALNAHIFSRYLFGGAMNDAKVKWSVHRQSTVFTPPGNDQFNFGQETWWWDDKQPESYSDFFGSGEGRVNAKGALDVAAGAVEAPGDKTFSYTVEAEVEDVNRQTVAGRAALTVHPAGYYVGLRAPTGFPKTGEAFHVDALVVDVKGKRVAGREVAVTLTRRTWKSVRQKDASGGFTTISEPVEEKAGECKVDSAETAAECQLSVKQPGFYIARATVADERKRKQTASLGLYVTGPGFVAWQRDDTERVDLVPDKNVYDVGDVAHVLIKSPYPEARALLTVEREGVLQRRQFVLQGSVQTVDIPITEEMVPNVFAGVMLMRKRVSEGGIESGDDPGRPAVRVGLTKLGVERKVKRLTVAVTTDKPEYRPAQEVAVDVMVKDSAGKGAAAEVTVYAVDEAVLRLTNYKVPDPIAAIFPERPLSIRIGEPLLHLVRRRNYGEKGEDRGGGGGASGEGAGYRSNFKTTVLFNPAVETDASGHAHVKFKLPDNLTTFRIMAVAVTPEDRFGSGEASVKVNKPLLVLPALPRFARVGDKFEAGVVVHSYGGGTGEVKVTAAIENGKLTGPAEQQVQVGEGSPREVRFPFTVEKPGIATLRFKAVRGEDQDGVEQKIPVELPVALEAVATYGDTQDQRVEGISPPKDVRPELGGLEVTMASTAMGNFQEGMRQLVEYPYGCLEQQSSRLVPFVALREIAGKFGVAWRGPDPKKQAGEDELNAFFREYLFDPLDVSHLKDPDQVVRATVDSIQKLQDPDGSFRYWSDAYCPDSWSSAYATMALHRAADVGYKVDAEGLNRADAFLEKVAGGGCHPCEMTCPDETRVFATYVLARARKPKPSYYEQFFKKRESLPLFTQAILADAMFVGGGDRAHAKQLLQEILNHSKESAKGVHFEETHGATYATLWHSDTRTTGVVLEMLTDIAPDHPYVAKIAHYLQDVRRGDGEWRSTQEAAFSLMGLTELVRTKEKDTPDYSGKASLGTVSVMQETFKGRSMAVKDKVMPMSELLAKTSGAGQKLTFSKTGTGVLYYSATMRYAPQQLPMTPLDQGLYVQRWFEPFSGGGQTTKFYAGDLVRVRVRIATNQERHWTAFEVPLPAGIEPVDTSLATTAGQAMSAHDESKGEGYEYESDEDQASGSAYEEEGNADSEARAGPWASRFWSPFNHIEQRDSRVVLFADHLPPGVHTSSFVARATTPGTYLLKPATGQLMYEPEVFGRSEGGTFEVVLPAEVSER